MQHEAFSYDSLVTADTLVTQDEERRVLHNAAVAVRDGRIAAVGAAEDFAGARAKTRTDLGRCLLMPGLVNAHSHISMTFLRGFADDLPLMTWLTEHIFPMEKHLTPDIVELGALLGCAEMIRTGTTAFCDMYLIADAVAAAVEKSGLRANIGEVLFAFPSPAYPTPDAGLALVRAQAERWAGHDRIKIGVMPHAVYTTTPELLAGCRDLAAELGLPLQMHLAETRDETSNFLETNGKRPVAYCDELGLFGPSVSIAHGVDLTGEEMDLLAAKGVTEVHNPRSNMKLASGIAPVPGMEARGMLPALGTDGPASNNALNMFSEMSACALLHKVNTGDPTICPAQGVLDMATLGGAAALCRPDVGRIAPGAAADMIALDLTSPNMMPMFHPVSHLVYAASGHEVCMTMVGGEVLYRDGVYTSIDYPALVEEAQGLRQWVEEKL